MTKATSIMFVSTASIASAEKSPKFNLGALIERDWVDSHILNADQLKRPREG